MTILISADELAERLAAERADASGDVGGSGPRTVVLDVRWSLAAPDGRPAYAEGHVPGAIYVDLDTELADHSAVGQGRHPLPSEAAFTGAMRRWGLREGDAVVVMDDLGNQSAARAWWLLRYAGFDAVRMLDGGLAAWQAAGHRLETGPGPEGGSRPDAPGDVVAHFGAMPVIDIDEAEGFARAGVLLDARAVERYRGEVEPIDPRAGHIPGARSAPSGGSLDAAGRFLPPAALRERFAAVGADGTAPVAAYCGSGVTAAHTVAALAIAGVDAALYPGSFSQWSNDASRVVETGSPAVETGE